MKTLNRKRMPKKALELTFAKIELLSIQQPLNDLINTFKKTNIEARKKRKKLRKAKNLSTRASAAIPMKKVLNSANSFFDRFFVSFSH